MAPLHQGSQGSSDSLRRTQSALAPAIVRSLQDYRTLSGFALQGYCAHEDLLDAQPSLQGAARPAMHAGFTSPPRPS